MDKIVGCCLFDIVGHLDLIKLWGHRPVIKSSLHYVLPVLHSIKAAGMIIEINSAGIRKPVREMYPALDIIEEMFRLGLPVTMGSDAHLPIKVAEDFTDILEFCGTLVIESSGITGPKNLSYCHNIIKGDRICEQNSMVIS